MNIEFILNTTSLIILITNIFIVLMNLGNSQNVTAKFFPFNSLSCDKNFLACCNNTDSTIIQRKEIKSAQNSSLLLNPTPDLELLVNQFNYAATEHNYDPENISSSKYCVTDEVYNLHNKNKSLPLFHKIACSLNNFNDLEHLLSCTKNKFDIIGARN